MVDTLWYMTNHHKGKTKKKLTNQNSKQIQVIASSAGKRASASDNWF